MYILSESSEQQNQRTAIASFEETLAKSIKFQSIYLIFKVFKRYGNIKLFCQDFFTDPSRIYKLFTKQEPPLIQRVRSASGKLGK